MTFVPPWLASFLQNVTKQPIRDAVVTDRRRVTFAELERLAGGLQRSLLRIAPSSSVVAITVTDPIERVVAVLAVAAAGKAHVVLDPALGGSALEGAASRCGASSIIGCAENSEVGPTILPADISPASLEPVVLPVEAPFAYVSTSGSTGDPKFVMLDHRATGSHLPGEPPDSEDEDRTFSRFNFSGNTVNSTIDCLRSGTTLLTVDPRAIPPSQLLDFLSEERATVVRMSPSLSRLILRTKLTRTSTLRRVRQIKGGGEAMLWSDVADLRSIVPDTAVILHGYASTETRGVTQKIITSSDPLGEGAVPAGFARLGRRVWIDAGDGLPADPGVVGTIVIEGIFGTRGPTFEGLPDGWLRFRSGDLGELTENGELLHRGRSDRAIKVGAMRVDLDAIEDALRQAPGVMDVCAVPIATRGCDPRIIAHIVPGEGCEVEVQQLRRFAAARLTSAAVPVRFEVRNTPIPLLPSGKKDVRRLIAQTEKEQTT